jgi:hypothetical protein
VVSWTVTVNDPVVDLLPDASVAVQFTVVEPSGNVAPEPGVQLTAGAGSTLSLTVTENGTLAPAGLVASAVLGPGTERVGAVVSRTLTLNAVEVELPDASVAVHETVVVPSGNVLPEAGEQATCGDGSIASDAVTENETGAPDALTALAFWSPGLEIVGGVRSTTVTEND